jgi:hypothetical protein
MLHGVCFHRCDGSGCIRAFWFAQTTGPDTINFSASSYTGFEAPLPFKITPRASPVR